MKVKDLVRALQDMNQEALVILAGGHEVTPLRAAQSTPYDPEHDELAITELTDELREEGYTDDDITPEEETVAAVVLCP